MKRFMYALFLLSALFVAVPSHAQATFLIGGTGGSLYGNDFGGMVGRGEFAFDKSRLELDAAGELSPHIHFGGYTINLEHKIDLGGGYAYSYGGTGRVWFTKGWHTAALGANAGIEQSTYSVTATSKTEYFAKAGLSYRRLWFGIPTRFDLDYVREVHDGIMSNGDESNHLQGGSFTFDSRMGCFSITCVRMVTNIQGGQVLNQGNPVCDGTYPIAPGGQHCPRQAAMGGGASMSLYFEFPRRKDTENLPF